MVRLFFALQLILSSSLLFLLGTTGFFVFGYTSDFFATQFTNWWVSFSASVLATVITTNVIDGLFGLLLPLVAAMHTGQQVDGIKTKYQSKMKWVITLAAIICGTLTGGFSILGTEDLATDSVAETDISEFTNTERANTDGHVANLSVLQDELELARATQEEREAKAKADGRALVRSAISTGSKGWQRDWKSSRTWMTNRKQSTHPTLYAYVRRILKAEADAAQLLATERGKIEPLKAAVLQMSTTGKLGVDEMNGVLATRADKLLERDERKIRKRTIGLLIGDLVALFVAVLLTFILAMCDVPERKAKYDASKILINTTFIIKQWFLSWFAMLDKHLKKFIEDGADAGAVEVTVGSSSAAVGPGGVSAPLRPHSPPSVSPTTTPVKSPHSVAHSFHSPTAPTVGPVGSAPHGSVAGPTAKAKAAHSTSPHSSRTAAPHSTTPAPKAATADSKEIERVDKRCRRRWDLHNIYSAELATATDPARIEFLNAKVPEKLTDYLEDKEWLEFNGRVVYINKKNRVTVEKG
jgi:hypothetical protein